MILKATYDIPTRDIKAEDIFRTDQPGVFIEKGLARRLTRDEIDTILDSYVAEAAKLLYGNS